MGSYTELIKNFDKTRDYVRDFFIYGFKVRQDFTQKSSRTYDDERRRVESWLGEVFRCETTERGKQVSLSVNTGHCLENPLHRAYDAKSFTDNDIRLHFLLLDLLADGSAHTVRELTELLMTTYGLAFDEQTVRGKLREYVREGIFVCSRVGRSDVYRLTKDTPAAFCADFPGLTDALAFFSLSAEFGIIARTLLQAIGKRNTLFLMKHAYIVHTLEEEILLAILQQMQAKYAIRIQCFNQRGNTFQSVGVPLKIHASTRTGRRYLIMYLFEKKRFYSFRLDTIKRLTDCGGCADYDQYAALLAQNADRCFGVSFGSENQHRPHGPIRVTFRIDPWTEGYVLERLEREKRCGSVTQIGPDRFLYTADIFDPSEMMSWLKTFLGRIVSIEGADAERRKFWNDVYRMYRMYQPKEVDE